MKCFLGSEMTLTQEPRPLPGGGETDICKSAEVLLLVQGGPLDGHVAAEEEQADAVKNCSLGRPLIGHLARMFLEIARCRSTSPAILTAEGTWTYQRLAVAATAVRDELLSRNGFQSGARVVLLADNSPEYVAALYGILLAGGVAVPLPPDAEQDRLNYVLETCESTLVLTTPRVLRRRSILPDSSATTLVLSKPGRAPCEERPGHSECPGRSLAVGGSADDLAVILFTSGSTGEPKGVMLSHQNLLSNAWTISEYLHITHHERPLVLLPFYHAFGNSILQSHLLAGATLILDGSLAFPNSILKAIEEHRATSFSGVPEVYRTLLTRSSLGKRSLKSLRYTTVAGGALPSDQALEVARRIAPAKFYVMYGQTEATARLSYLRPEFLAERPGSIGKGLDGVTLQVVDEHDRQVRPGRLGQIRARGPNVMLGYFKDSAATSRVIRGGWLYTGDLAVTDADGFIYLRGRSNALVKVRGHRLHPAEVEEFVMQRLPGVRAVVVPYETPKQGTRLALFVQPLERFTAEPGSASPVLPGTTRTAVRVVQTPARSAAERQTLSVNEIDHICRQGLPRHKVPAYVEIVDELPLNDALKVNRPSLARRAMTRSGCGPCTPARARRGMLNREISR